jgi:hypothetical protein
VGLLLDVQHVAASRAGLSRAASSRPLVSPPLQQQPVFQPDAAQRNSRFQIARSLPGLSDRLEPPFHLSVDEGDLDTFGLQQPNFRRERTEGSSILRISASISPQRISKSEPPWRAGEHVIEQRCGQSCGLPFQRNAAVSASDTVQMPLLLRRPASRGGSSLAE